MKNFLLKTKKVFDIKVAIKGSGDLASGIVNRLFKANIRNIHLMELEQPISVRRAVAFSDAVVSGKVSIEGVVGVLVQSSNGIKKIIDQGKIPIMVDPFWKSIRKRSPDVLIDAIMAKKNIGTNIEDASLVLGLGPGFKAGYDVDFVIETKRGHSLGKVLGKGYARENTSIPELVDNFSFERVLRAPNRGFFRANCEIGDLVKVGDVVASIENQKILSHINGVVRGLIKTGTIVKENMKIADIDPRGIFSYCGSISDKARSVGGAVLEVILGKCMFGS